MGDASPFKQMARDADPGKAPASSQQTMDQILKAYVKNLPDLFKVTAAGTPVLAGGDLEAQRLLTPALNQLALEQVQQFALPLANLQSANNAALLRGSGADAAMAAAQLRDRTDPEYAALRKQVTGRAGDLLGSINLEGLSGGERAEVERALNQSNYATGNLGIDNATNVVRNAMAFGDRMAGKRAELGNAIGAASGAIGTQNTAFNPVALALGGPAGTATTNFQPVAQTQAGQTGATFGQGLFGNLTSSVGNQNQLTADYNWKASDRWAYSDIGKNVGSICCFIFLEIYNGTLPWYVRVERDKYYHQQPELAVGYKKMASWLVPLMREYTPIRHAVNWLMVKPLTWYGAWTHKLNLWGWLFAPVKSFWFKVWKVTAE